MRTYIIIKQKQPLPRLDIQPLQEILRDVRRPPRHALQAQLAEEHLDEDRSPRVRSVRRDDLVQLGVPGGLLLGGHDEALVDRCCNVLKTQKRTQEAHHQHAALWVGTQEHRGTGAQERRNRTPTPRFHGLTNSASSIFLLIPINSLNTLGFLPVPFCAITNSMLVVFIPSLRGVMSARSATESSA